MTDDTFELKINAPPRTAGLIRLPENSRVFRHIAYKAAEAERKKVKSAHSALFPNFVELTPYNTPDGATQYIVSSCVQLAGSSRLQVQENAIDIILVGDEGYYGLVAVDCDAEKTISNTLGSYQSILDVSSMYSVETGSFQR